MKRFKKNYLCNLDIGKWKKYNRFKGKIRLFTKKQINEIKSRISKARSILKMEVGEHNAKRLLSYPCINNGITHKGICVVCGFENDLIRFDDNTSICESCASDKNLI